MSTLEEVPTKFFFNPLRSRLLWTFVVVHFALAILLGEIYIFAPDEGLYTGIFNHIYRAGFSIAGLIGWSNSPLYFLRAIYLPGKLLVMAGVPDYLAIRILAILTSGAAIYLLMCVFRKVRKNSDRLPRVLIVALLIPSVFLWMTLGLRESFIFLALAMICSGLYLLGHESMRSGFLLLFLGNLLLFNTKSYLFVVVFAASLIQMFFKLVSQRRFKIMQIYVVTALVLPLLINPVGTKYVIDGIKGQFTVLATTGTSGTASIANQSIDIGTTGLGLSAELTSHPNSPFTKLLKAIGTKPLVKKQPTPTSKPSASASATPTPTSKPSASASVPPTPTSKPSASASVPPTPTSKPSASASVPPTPTSKPSASASVPQTTAPTHNISRMDVSPAHLTNPLSIMARAGGFLFTPFPFIDNGSMFLDIAALEAPFWWFVYFAFGLAVWRRFKRREFDELAIFVLSFVALFIVFSALTEINVGTMVRHRSVLLIPMLFLVMSQTKKSIDT